MDLLQLRYFYESAQNENFSVTARKFMVPPSSVSAAVKRLEKELGQHLFDRTVNRIKLNHNGIILFDALDTAFSQIDNAVEAIKFSGEQSVDIKILVRARSKWVTDLVVEFKRTHPNVFFYITNNTEITDYDLFDIIIDELTEQYGNRERFLLSVETLCIKAVKTSPLVGKTLTLSDIADQPFVLMGRGNAMRRLIEKIGKQNGFVPNIAIECTDRQCIFNCVENGMGLTIGSAHALQDDNQKNIAALNVTDFNEQQLVYVYYQKPKHGKNAIDSFIAFLESKSRI